MLFPYRARMPAPVEERLRRILERGEFPLEHPGAVALHAFKEKARERIVLRGTGVLKVRASVIEELIAKLHVVVATVEGFAKYTAG